MTDNLIFQLTDILSDEAGMDRDIARSLLKGEDTGDGTMGEDALWGLIASINAHFYSAFYCSNNAVGFSPALMTLFGTNDDPDAWLAAARGIDPTESNLAAALRDTDRENLRGG